MAEEDSDATQRFVSDMVAAIFNPEVGASFGDMAEVWDNPTLREKVANRDYAGIQNYLRAHKEMVNGTMTFGPTDFTGLEWALWRDDYKMCALFFVHGADPECNVFDGVVHSHASYEGYAEPDIVDGFDSDDPQPIKGFAGLRLLINQDDDSGKAYLYIMECLHRGSITLPDQYHHLASCIDAVSNDLQYSAADFKSFVLVSFLSLKRMGLSSDVALPIVEHAVLNALWTVLESFATRGLTVDDSQV